MRNSVSMEAKTENEELVEKLVEAPTRPWPRPGKPELNRLAPQSQSVEATPESGARGARDCEGPALSGRETDAEVLPSASRPTRDGPWRQNLDGPGLLGKPGGVGRSQGRETEANLSTSRQPKNLRRANNDLDAARRNEPVNDPDSWWKPTRDLDGTKVGTDNDVIVNRFRKEMTKSEGSKGSLPGSSERQTEKKFRESPDRESGEWRESTPGLEQLDTKGKSRSSEAAPVSGLILNRSQIRDLRKPSPGKGAPAGDFSKRPSPGKAVPDFRRPSPGIAAGGELRKPSPVTAVGDLRNPSPAKGAGDIRKPSPVTSNAQKLGQAFQKEVSRSDQAVARETNRAVSEMSKVVPSSEVEERPEGGPLRNSRASNDTFERPMDFRAAKRQLDDGSGEPSKVVKKSSGASVAPASSFNRGVSERKQVSPSLAQKPQASEADRGGPIEGPTSLAGPSGKASGIENGRKQRILSTAQKSSAKDGMELPRVVTGNRRPLLVCLDPEVRKNERILNLTHESAMANVSSLHQALKQFPGSHILRSMRRMLQFCEGPSDLLKSKWLHLLEIHTWNYIRASCHWFYLFHDVIRCLRLCCSTSMSVLHKLCILKAVVMNWAVLSNIETNGFTISHRLCLQS